MSIKYTVRFYDDDMNLDRNGEGTFWTESEELPHEYRDWSYPIPRLRHRVLTYISTYRHMIWGYKKNISGYAEIRIDFLPPCSNQPTRTIVKAYRMSWTMAAEDYECLD